MYYGREGLNVLGIRAMIEAEVELNRMDLREGGERRATMWQLAIEAGRLILRGGGSDR